MSWLRNQQQKIKTLTAGFRKHITTFVGEQDYSKRHHNPAVMPDAVTKGKKMLDELMYFYLGNNRPFSPEFVGAR